jgi:hypothetical protein
MFNVCVVLARKSRSFHAQHVAQSFRSDQTKMSLNCQAFSSSKTCWKLWRFNEKQKRAHHVHGV